MLASFTHILPLTTVVRKRLLPCDGRVLVKVGQKVDSADRVAEAIIGRKHLVLDVARELNVSPRRAASLIKIKRGQKVNRDEIIAESSGLFAREVTAPVDGRVVVIGGGKLVIETGGSPVEILAGMQGMVTDIIPARGVVIRATGSVIQGVWGNGLLDTGVMMSAMDRPDEDFDISRLDVAVRSAIILGGYVDNPMVFESAADLPVRGLILSSMSPELIPLVSQLAYPVILMEGFGRRPINSVAYKLLSTSIRRVINLNAAVYDWKSGDRPEVFISLPVSQEPPEPREIDTFNPGQTVRVVSLINSARLGTLLQLSSNQLRLPNGVKVRTATVKLGSGEQILVPLTNLEVLG